MGGTINFPFVQLKCETPMRYENKLSNYVVRHAYLWLGKITYVVVLRKFEITQLPFHLTKSSVI